MKRSIILAFLLLPLLALRSEAQPKSSLPNWISEKGYWVVESNLNDRLNHKIWFYNNQNVLVYQETVTGTRLNTSKRKLRMKLKRILEIAILASERNDNFPREQGLLSSTR
jgi:hypothetical protein